MPPRTSWTGTLKLSLITIPVRLYRAVSSTNRTRLNMLHEGCNQRIHYQYTCPVHGEIPKDDITKGYQYEKGHYVVLKDEDLQNVKLETTKTLEIVEFVDTAQLDPVYIDAPYYLSPDGPVAEEGFRVLREAMRQEGKSAIGRVTMSGREHVVAISPYEKGLILTTLHYAPEIRRPEPFFSEITEKEVKEDELELARQLISNKSREFNPEDFHDRYEEALNDLIQAKLKGEKPEVVAPEAPGKIVDFMDALKRSIAEESKGERAQKGRRKASEESAKHPPARKKKSSG